MHLKIKNFVYTPIPKSACTTLKKECLRIMDDKRAIKGKITLTDRHNITDIHLFFKEAGFLRVSENNIVSKNLFHFSFVRDPYDRFVSAYLSKIKNKSYISGTKYFSLGGVSKAMLARDNRLKGGVSFPRFVELFQMNKKIRKDIHFKPQTSFISDSGWDRLNFLGRVETFDADWKELCGLIGIDYCPLEKINSSISPVKYREFYTPEILEVVEHYYAKDLERFNYSF